MRIRVAAAAFIITFLATSCASLPIRKGGPAIAAEKNAFQITINKEQLENTKTVESKIKTHAAYHDAVLEPASYTNVNKYPFYLLGFEKPRNVSTSPYIPDSQTDSPGFDPNQFTSSDPKDADAVKETQLNFSKHFIKDSHHFNLTHILRIKSPTTPNDFIYNIYYGNGNNKQLETKWPRQGWRALDELGTSIQKDVALTRATHIILMATGWNTREYESFSDFTYWQKIIQKNMKDEANFRPIVIGVAWESTYRPSWWKTLLINWSPVDFYNPWTFFNKGNDADEIGYAWINYLLNKVLVPISSANNLHLVCIGHSFGSRIVLEGHYARGILVPKVTDQESNAPVTIIALEPALANRSFIPKNKSFIPNKLRRSQPHPFLKTNIGEATVAATWSDKDKATSTIHYFTTGYLGGDYGHQYISQHINDSFAGVVELQKANANGTPETLPRHKIVNLYDASSFINKTLEGTGNGSHSDVYNDEVGAFIAAIIKN